MVRKPAAESDILSDHADGLGLVALAIGDHLALAKLAQRLNVRSAWPLGSSKNTVFSEFLFHCQCLFGCKVTKFSTKAFIARQKNAFIIMLLFRYCFGRL